MNNEVIIKVLELCQDDIMPCEHDDLTEVEVPRFQLPSGFNYFSLFSIANNYFPFATVYQMSSTNQNRNNSYNLLTKNTDPTFDYTSAFKNLCEKIDPRYFDTFSLQEDTRSLYDDAFYSKLTKLSDRNPNLFANICQTHQNSMSSAQFQWIDLDQIDTQSFSQENLINFVLSTNSTPDQPIVFYGDEIGGFPISVGLLPGQPFIYESLPVENLKEIRASYNTQLTLFFAIGSDEEGVPVLFLVSGKSIVKIYDNQTICIDDIDDIRNCKIKMLCYTIPGNQWKEGDNKNDKNLVFKYKCTPQSFSKNSSIHPRIASSTADSFLLNFIHWEKNNKWLNNEFSLKEYLIECIEHPSIFLSDFDDVDDKEPASFISSVCVYSDSNCKNFIFPDEDEDEERNIKSSFYAFTDFTVFVRVFVNWLESIKDNKKSEFEYYLRGVFYHMPVCNRYITYAVIKLICDVCIDQPTSEAYQIFDKIFDDVNELGKVSQSFLDKLPKILEKSQNHKSISVLVQRYRDDTPEVSPKKIVDRLEKSYDIEAIPALSTLPYFDSNQENDSFEFNESYTKIQGTALSSIEIRY